MTHQFRILGISPTRNLAAIKKAYRAKALLLHPDHGGNPESFRELTSAYDFLIHNAKTMSLTEPPKPVYTAPQPPPPPPISKIYRTVVAKQLMDDSFYCSLDIPSYLKGETFELYCNWTNRANFKIVVPHNRMGSTAVLDIDGQVLKLALKWSEHIFETREIEGEIKRQSRRQYYF